jgi:hypothetical protein
LLDHYLPLKIPDYRRRCYPRFSGSIYGGYLRATARDLEKDTGVEVSTGFVASRTKRMAAKEALQKSG